MTTEQIREQMLEQWAYISVRLATRHIPEIDLEAWK